jgi:hypothetical protein
MNLLGVPRLTMDVDLVVGLDEANLDAFLAAAGALGMKPALPLPPGSLKDPAMRREWIGRRNMIAFPMRVSDPGSPTLDDPDLAPARFQCCFWSP